MHLCSAMHRRTTNAQGDDYDDDDDDDETRKATCSVSHQTPGKYYVYEARYRPDMDMGPFLSTQPNPSNSHPTQTTSCS